MCRVSRGPRPRSQMLAVALVEHQIKDIEEAYSFTRQLETWRVPVVPRLRTSWPPGDRWAAHLARRLPLKGHLLFARTARMIGDARAPRAGVFHSTSGCAITGLDVLMFRRHCQPYLSRRPAGQRLPAGCSPSTSGVKVWAPCRITRECECVRVLISTGGGRDCRASLVQV
jgi:hypothetical protein